MTPSWVDTKNLELERMLTTGSRIASVKLSGGDIFIVLESAFITLDRCLGVKHVKEVFYVQTTLTAQDEIGHMEKKAYIVGNSRASVELSAT